MQVLKIRSPGTQDTRLNVLAAVSPSVQANRCAPPSNFAAQLGRVSARRRSKTNLRGDRLRTISSFATRSQCPPWLRAVLLESAVRRSARVLAFPRPGEKHASG